MSRYRKLIAAIVGLVAIILGPSFLGVAPGEDLFSLDQERIVEMILAVLTALGVERLPNEPMEPKA